MAEPPNSRHAVDLDQAPKYMQGVETRSHLRVRQKETELNLSFRSNSLTKTPASRRIIHNIKRVHYIRPAQCANQNKTHTNRASRLSPRFKVQVTTLLPHKLRSWYQTRSWYRSGFCMVSPTWVLFLRGMSSA